MHNRFIKTVLVCAMATVALTGCQKTFKSEDSKPAKLVNIAAPVSVLSPVLQVSLDQSRNLAKGERISKKNVVDLQVAVTKSGIIAASRGGLVSAFVGNQAVWTVNLKQVITSGVAIDEHESIVVVGTRSGEVVALNANTGEKLWETTLTTSSVAPALIHADRVLLSANNGVLYGLDLQTGSVVWELGTQRTGISVRGIAEPLALDAKTVLFGTADGRIHALDSGTGMPLWNRRVGMATGGSSVEHLRDVDGTPLVMGQHLYVTSFSGQLAGFDMATGRTMFVADIKSTKSPAILGELLIATGVRGDVRAFNRLTGETVWLSESLKNRQLTNPVTVGDYVAVGDYDGVIHLFDRDGEIVSRVQTKGQLTSLQVKDNRLYTQSAAGVISVWQF